MVNVGSSIQVVLKISSQSTNGLPRGRILSGWPDPAAGGHCPSVESSGCTVEEVDRLIAIFYGVNRFHFDNSVLRLVFLIGIMDFHFMEVQVVGSFVVKKTIEILGRTKVEDMAKRLYQDFGERNLFWLPQKCMTPQLRAEGMINAGSIQELKRDHSSNSH